MPFKNKKDIIEANIEKDKSLDNNQQFQEIIDEIKDFTLELRDRLSKEFSS